MSRVIVITGAGIGLGRALARRFAKQGETLVLLGRTLSKVKAVADELGAPAMAVECDVASPASVKKAFAEIAAAHPKIDVLINNAAVYEPFLIAEASDAQIMSIITTNLAGPMLCARSAIPLMSAGGHIINVSSESAGMLFPYLVAYQTSKAGLDRFSEGLYHELKPAGIRVTNVRCGMMIDEPIPPNWDPQVAMRFAQANAAIGRNLREQPLSQVNSVTAAFHAILDMPPDLHMANVHLHASKAA
ncbi:SDR family oxidoreductase [Solimonas terrae]|uniref:SDR family oxidoreductase n=1 Tax=Solimonas terrae TaxID=1396819 RepID=A0A6M2BNI1_9GAMM|nr:SDR family oxidoreductase [Solimonas terrae]NGY03934.1 SDR family oxidoreductase [Solimonas terrae]